MTFLAPWYLLLAGAAVVPLLIHLLRRRIGVEVEFPAARYLARAEREHSRTLRLRNLLLMLLRVLAVLLVAAAASRPAIRGAAIAGGHAPTALAVLIDNSMSTGVVEDGAPLLEQLKRAARDAVANATADDRVYVVTADGGVRGGTPVALRAEIERVRPLAGGGNLPDALSRAVAAVRSSGLDERHVAVLTDGQRTAWIRPLDILGEKAAVLVWAPEKPAPRNGAVVMAEARPVRWTPRGAIALRMTGIDSSTYRISLGTRTLARGTVAAGEEALVRAAPAERGWIAGSVEIEPDELAADNVRHFALWIGPAPSVRVTAGAGGFARSAVDVLRASGQIAETEVKSVGMGGSGISIASADEASSMPALLAAPADPVRLGAANRALERLGIPWRFGPARRQTALVRGERLAGVSVAQRYALQAQGAAAAETLAVVGMEPWVVGGPGYVLVGSPLTPDASTLPVSAAFLPWLSDVLASRLHQDRGTVLAASPGQSVVRPSGVDGLEASDGARTALRDATFDAPAAAGTYFLIDGGRRVGALAVNAEAAESRLDRWPGRELGSRVASPPASRAGSTSEWVRLAFSGSPRRSLVLPLLVAAFVVLAAETLLSVSGRGPLDRVAVRRPAGHAS